MFLLLEVVIRSTPIFLYDKKRQLINHISFYPLIGPTLSVSCIIFLEANPFLDSVYSVAHFPKSTVLSNIKVDKKNSICIEAGTLYP